MKVAGIVAEYNPFHMGHQYHIQKIREQLGSECAIVCVMSGDFVQRGEPAVYSKFARAEAAVRSGADLVLELPLPWCMASAERFAQGAVHILGSLGVIDVLSFGSESGDALVLEQVAQCLDSAEFGAGLSRFLDEGMPFAACRQAVVEGILGEKCAQVLSNPNDNLGVEYLKAIRREKFPMAALPIQRVGSGHDELEDGPMMSGAQLRKYLVEGQTLEHHIPEQAYQVFSNEDRVGREPVLPSVMEPLILSRLRMLGPSAFAALPDASEGLDRKLYSACQTEPSLEAIYANVKSKRYPHARIRRMTLCAALGIKNSDFDQMPPYARILAFNENGSAVLKQAQAQTSIPIISKPSAIRKMGPAENAIFDLNVRAHDLYVLSWKNAIFHAGGQDWQESPRRIYEQLIEFL